MKPNTECTKFMVCNLLFKLGCSCDPTQEELDALSYREILEFPLMQVGDVSADTVQEVLWVWYEDKDSLEPDRWKARLGKLK